MSNASSHNRAGRTPPSGSDGRNSGTGLLKVSRISPVTAFGYTDHFTHNGGEVRISDLKRFIEQDKINHAQQASQMGLAAAKLAMVDSQLDEYIWTRARKGVCIGITSG